MDGAIFGLLSLPIIAGVVIGTIRMFDPATNTFGSFGPNGMTKTFFKSTSPTYWSRQPGVLQ